MGEVEFGHSVRQYFRGLQLVFKTLEREIKGLLDSRDRGTSVGARNHGLLRGNRPAFHREDGGQPRTSNR